MKFIVIKASPTNINFRNLQGEKFAEGVLLEITRRLKSYSGNLTGVRGLAQNGSALEYSNSSGVCYWIFSNTDKNAIDAIIEEGESLNFAEIGLCEQRSNEFWRKNFSIHIENIEFTQINRMNESNKLFM